MTLPGAGLPHGHRTLKSQTPGFTLNKWEAPT